MKARGLDPKEISETAGDDAPLKSKGHSLSESKQQESVQQLYDESTSITTTVSPYIQFVAL